MDAYEAVSLPGSAALTGKKYFTLEKANRSLTLVRRIVRDVVQEYHRVLALRDACSDRARQAQGPEVERARNRYLGAADRLAELNEELEKIGCELKDFQCGLVDFPGMLDGREVCLCWKLDEERIEHWHEVDTGFSGRRPILDGNF
jgi:hypothetical protein